MHRICRLAFLVGILCRHYRLVPLVAGERFEQSTRNSIQWVYSQPLRLTQRVPVTEFSPRFSGLFFVSTVIDFSADLSEVQPLHPCCNSTFLGCEYIVQGGVIA